MCSAENTHFTYMHARKTYIHYKNKICKQIIETHLAAVDVFHSRFTKNEIHEITCFKTANELWRIKPFRIVLFGAHDWFVVLQMWREKKGIEKMR